jgi:hypothetical protein
MIDLNSAFIRNLHDSYDPPTEAEFSAFEAEIGAALPPDYRELLQHRNGSRFYRTMGYPIPASPVHPKNDNYSDLGVGWFTNMFHLGNWNRSHPSKDFSDECNLQYQLDFYEGRIAPKTLPIAESGDTQLFLLDIGDDYGSVFIWDRDEEDPDEPSKNKFFAAPSVGDWIQKSRIDIEPTDVTEKLPPFRAIQQLDMNGLRGMLDAGLNPNTVNETGVPLLYFCCDSLYYDAAELLLIKHADPNLESPYQKTPMYISAAQGTLDLVKLLLRHGAEAHLPSQPEKRLTRVIPRLSRRIADLLRNAP